MCVVTQRITIISKSECNYRLLCSATVILGLFQGFTYVAPSVLEEMYKPPRIVKARSPRKSAYPTPVTALRNPFSPRHHLSPATGFTFGSHNLGSPLDSSSCQEEMMEVQGLPHV
jgi:p70 ribosomal S6 kinase